MVISLLIVFSFCAHTSVTLPANTVDKHRTNALWVRSDIPEDSKLKSTERTRRSSVSSRTLPSTIASSFKSTRKTHSARILDTKQPSSQSTPTVKTHSAQTLDTKQPSSKSTPTLTPANPSAHASNAHVSTTPLHVLSHAPIKPMTASQESSEDAGCICLCHETEIHEPAPPEPAKVEMPTLPKAPGDCCTYKCGKCNVTLCKVAPPEGNNEPCKQALAPAKNSSGSPTIELGTCPNQCAVETCATKCPSGAASSIVNTKTGNSCPLDAVHPSNMERYIPKCITTCNNNYLGHYLEYGGQAPMDENSFQFDSAEGRQPTTRKVSTLSPLASMNDITETARADIAYNPIQPMPTQPAVGPDDIIVHHILVAEEYITQHPTDYVISGNPL